MLNGTRVFWAAVPLDNTTLGADAATYDGRQRIHASACRASASTWSTRTTTTASRARIVSFRGTAAGGRRRRHAGLVLAAALPRLRLESRRCRADKRLRRACRVLRARGPESSFRGRLCDQPQRHRLLRGHEPGPDRRHLRAARTTRTRKRESCTARPRRSSQRLDPTPHRLSPFFGQPGHDVHEQLLSELRARPGTLRLVRALGDQGREAGLHVRIRHALFPELDHVPRLLQGQAALAGHNGKVPYEFCLAEWDSQWLGDSAFKLSEDGKDRLALGSRKSSTPGKPGSIGTTPSTFADPVFDGIRKSSRAIPPTTGGPSAPGASPAPAPGRIVGYWKLRDGVDKGRKDLKVDWDKLQRPGYSPDFIDERYDSHRPRATNARTGFPPSRARRCCATTSRCWPTWAARPERSPKRATISSLARRSRNRLIVINNSRATVSCDCAGR